MAICVVAFCVGCVCCMFVWVLSVVLLGAALVFGAGVSVLCSLLFLRLSVCLSSVCSLSFSFAFSVLSCCVPVAVFVFLGVGVGVFCIVCCVVWG